MGTRGVEEDTMSDLNHNSYTSYEPKKEMIVVTCSVCGTKYTIITNTLGCFYCPTCNGNYTAGTEAFS